MASVLISIQVRSRIFVVHRHLSQIFLKGNKNVFTKFKCHFQFQNKKTQFVFETFWLFELSWSIWDAFELATVLFANESNFYRFLHLDMSKWKNSGTSILSSVFHEMEKDEHIFITCEFIRMEYIRTKRVCQISSINRLEKGARACHIVRENWQFTIVFP